MDTTCLYSQSPVIWAFKIILLFTLILIFFLSFYYYYISLNNIKQSEFEGR